MTLSLFWMLLVICQLCVLNKLLEKLRPFSFEVEWKEGKSHLIADALSRSPVATPDEEDTADDGIHAVNVFAAAAQA